MSERHLRQGYQTLIKNDLYMVEERLQEYDPHLYILYHPKLNQWLIMDGLMDIGVMVIPQKGFETLDSRVVEHMKKIHTARGFSAIKEIQKADERREKENKRQKDDLADNFARDMFNANDKKYLFKGA